MNPSFHDWAGDKRLKGLVLLVLALGAIALASYTYLSIKSGKYIYSGPTTISVRGVGEVTIKPNIASFSFNVHTEAVEPAAAQARSAEVSNAVIAYLKEHGVAEADIKTLSYNLSPRYRPASASMTMPVNPFIPQDIIGYTIDQYVKVKVRDTNNAGALIAGVGERGATDVSGLEFTIDDDTNAKAEARAKAVADAKEKAQQLADALGVRLVRLSGFWEDEGYYPMEEKYGREIMVDDALIAPDLPIGENTITLVVNLSYEIR